LISCELALALRALTPVAFAQGGEHLEKILLQDTDLVPRRVIQLGFQVAPCDLLAGADELPDGVNDAGGHEISETDGHDHSRDGDENEHGEQVLPHVHVLLLENSHVENAHPLPENVPDGFVGGDVPVAHHEGAVCPGRSVYKHLVAHFLGDARADGALPLGSENVGGDAQVLEEYRRRADAAVLEHLVLKNRFPHTVDDDVVAVQNDPSVENAHKLTLQEQR
jgi:hypothetical protein